MDNRFAHCSIDNDLVLQFYFRWKMECWDIQFLYSNRIVEVLFCLPAIFLHYLAFREMVPVIRSEVLLKSILAAISALCLGFTFYILKKAYSFEMDQEVTFDILALIFSVAIAHFIYKPRSIASKNGKAAVGL